MKDFFEGKKKSRHEHSWLAVPTEMSSASTFRQVQANKRSRHPIDKKKKLHLFIAIEVPYTYSQE
jgi:hypothetical protein